LEKITENTIQGCESMKAFCMVGDCQKTPSMERFANGLRRVMTANGYDYIAEPRADVQLVFNFVDPLQPRHFHREGKGTFVVTVVENDQPAPNILKAGYPILVRSLGNMMIYLDISGAHPQTYFITLEQGCYPVSADDDEARFYQRVFERLRPLATAKLVIDNRFDPEDSPGRKMVGQHEPAAHTISARRTGVSP
jgi:hypothetical protein